MMMKNKEEERDDPTATTGVRAIALDYDYTVLVSPDAGVSCSSG